MPDQISSAPIIEGPTREPPAPAEDPNLIPTGLLPGSIDNRANTSELASKVGVAENPYLTGDGKIIAINPKSGEVNHIDPGNKPIEEAIGQVRSDGWRLPADTSSKDNFTDDGKIIAINPKSGERTIIDPSGADRDAAIARVKEDGWLLPSEQMFKALEGSKSEKLKGAYGEELHKQGFFGYGAGPVDVAVERLISPIAKPNIKGTPQEQEAQRAAQEEYINEHPVGAYGGKITGEVGTALSLLGPAAEAAAGKVAGLGLEIGSTGSAAAQPIANALVSPWTKAVVEGAVFASPDVVQNTLENKPKEVAEALAIGIGGSVGLHFIGGLIGKPSVKELANVAGSKAAAADVKSYAALKSEIDAAKQEVRDREVAFAKADEKVDVASSVRNDQYKPNQDDFAKYQSTKSALDKAKNELKILQAIANAKIGTVVPSDFADAIKDANLEIERATENHAINDKTLVDARKKYDDETESLLKPAKEASSSANDALNSAKQRLSSAENSLSKHPLTRQNELEQVAKDEELTIAGNTFGKAIGMTPTKIANLREEFPELIRGAGITENDTVDSGIKKIIELQNSGKRIGDAVKQLDRFDEETVSNTISDALKKAKADIMEKLTGGGLIKDEETGKIKLLGNILVGPEADDYGKAISPAFEQLKALLEKEDPLTFGTDAQGLKKYIRDSINWSDGTPYTNGAKREVYSIIRGHLENAENQIAEAISKKNGSVGATIAQGLKQDRALYTLSQIFGDAAERADTRETLKTPLQKFVGWLPDIGRSYGIGGMFAHMIGGNVGLGVYGTFALAQRLVNLVQKKGLFGRSVKTILEKSAKPATDLAAEATAKANEHINNSVKSFLKDLYSDSKKQSKAVITRGAIAAMLPNNGAGLSSTQQIDAHRDQITKLLTDPNYASQYWETHAVASKLQHENLPQVSMAYQEHQMRLAKVIQAVIGSEGIKEVAPHPFATDVVPSEISEATRFRIENALKIANDPTTLLEKVKSNNISKADMAIAAATNPLMLNKLQMALMEEQNKSGKDRNLSYQQRLSLGILLGTNLDRATEPVSIQAIQAAFVPFHPTQGMPQSGGKKSSANSDSVASSFRTTSQAALDIGK